MAKIVIIGGWMLGKHTLEQVTFLGFYLSSDYDNKLYVFGVMDKFKITKFYIIFIIKDLERSKKASDFTMFFLLFYFAFSFLTIWHKLP